MQIFRDGTMVGENQRGAPPTFAVRRCLYVGRSNWTRDKPFHGSVRNLALWNEVLSWDELLRADRQIACNQAPPAPQPFVTAFGTKEPVVVYEGRHFAGSAADFEDLGSRYGEVVFGSALSVAFWARWDGLQPWSRIIDFGNGPDTNNFFIATHGMTRDLAFHVWAGGYEARLRVPEAVIPGKTNRYLCTVSESGHMRIWRDAKLLAEEYRGAPPSYGTRRFLYVGRSNWDRDRPFCGMISDLSVWNAVVSWEESKAPNLQKQWEDHRQEWECQGITRKEDGMWCTWCEKGPMTSATVVQRHLESKGHQKSLEQRGGPSLSTPAGKLELQKAWANHKLKWQRQGIEKKEDGFWCIWCEKGPITSTKLVEQHIDGKAHQKLFEQMEMKTQWEENQQEWESQGLEWREDGMWCTYCDKGPMVSARMVEQHIDGRIHQKTLEQRDLNKEWEKHRKEWEPQSIVYKDDGLWCICCDKGPMSASVVERHVESKGHQNKAALSQPLQLPATYLSQGIAADDNQPNPPTIAYKCKICDAGPFTALVVIDAHLQSRKHKKAMERKRALGTSAARPMTGSHASGGQIGDKENFDPANKHVDDDDGQGAPTRRVKWGGCESVEIEKVSSSDESDEMEQDQRLEIEKTDSRDKPVEIQETLSPVEFNEARSPDEPVAIAKAYSSDEPVDIAKAVSPIEACSPGEPIETKKAPSQDEPVETEPVAPWPDKPAEIEEASFPDSQVEFMKAPSPEEPVQIEKTPSPDEPVEIENAPSPDEPVELEEVFSPDKPSEIKGKPAENSPKVQSVQPDPAGVPDNLEASGMAASTHLCIGSAVRALEDTASIGCGYLALVKGETIKVLYLGSKATADEGWLFGHAISTDQQGWVFAKAVDIEDGQAKNTLACKVPKRTGMLPPGWIEVWDAEMARYYYADVEAQATQWEAPPPYVHGSWTRQADAAGYGFWICHDNSAGGKDANLFYEHGDRDWVRIVDEIGRTYWSHPPTGTRFFEKWSASMDSDVSALLSTEGDRNMNGATAD